MGKILTYWDCQTSLPPPHYQTFDEQFYSHPKIPAKEISLQIASINFFLCALQEMPRCTNNTFFEHGGRGDQRRFEQGSKDCKIDKEGHPSAPSASDLGKINIFLCVSKSRLVYHLYVRSSLSSIAWDRITSNHDVPNFSSDLLLDNKQTPLIFSSEYIINSQNYFQNVTNGRETFSPRKI